LEIENFFQNFQELKQYQDGSGEANSSESGSGIVNQDKIDVNQQHQESSEANISGSSEIQEKSDNCSQIVEAQSEAEIWDLLDTEFKNKLNILSSMGFLNQKLNYELLLQFENIDRVLEQLLN